MHVDQTEEGTNLDRGLSEKSCWLLCIMAVLIVVSGCAEEEGENGNTVLTPVDLLPADDDISGWGSPQTGHAALRTA